MAKSKAKKKREHILRNGGYVDGFRGNWNGINPLTKTTPTKREKLDKVEIKHKSKLLNAI
jgi:hypothetical protein